MEENRKQARIATDLPVMLVSVLESKDGRIIDLSEGGAQIVGASFPQGTRFQIDCMEQTVYARVMWDEIDRMGVRFEYPLTSGALFDVLHAGQLPQQAPRPFINTLARASGQGGFGRRAA